MLATIQKLTALGIAGYQRGVTLSGLRVQLSEAPVMVPARLTLADQWARMTGVVERAIGSAGETRKLQAAATQQLDLAQYALSTLMDELSAVMLVPGRRERAPVYVLETGAVRAVSTALAA
jgi:hypothetical protein